MAGLVILGLLVLLVMFVGSVSGLFAALRTRSLGSEIQELKFELRDVERRLRRGEAPDAAPGAVPEPPKPVAPAQPLPGTLLPPFAAHPPVSLHPPKPTPRPAPRPAPPLAGAVQSPPPRPVFAPIPEPATPASKRDSEWWANFEERVGKRWMTWAGALVVIVGMGFFVQYAIERDWLNEVARDSIGMAFGALLVCLGARFASKKMTALGQGLMGCGLGILYLSIYAAHGPHAWMEQWIAAGALVIVSAAGIALSVVFDALPVSLIAILGGLLTPIMVSTGRDERDLLFAYLLLLDVSVLGVAFFKRWRPLDIVAFVGTAALFLAWFGRYYPKEFDATYMWATMFWLGGFFLVFLLLPFAHHMRTKTPITVERFVMALVNATGVCTLAYYIMYANRPHALGYVVLGMSASYLILGALCRRLVSDDEKSVFGFLAISIVFFTISIPLHFGLNGVTLCWAAEAPLLLYLGYKYAYRPVKLAGFVMLIVLLGRFFLRHWPMHDAAFVWFQNPSFAIAMSVVVSAAAYALVHQWQRKHSLPEDRSLKVFAAVVSGFLVLIFINSEVAQYYQFSFGPRELAAMPEYFSGAVRAILWAAGAVVFLVCGLRARSPVAKGAAFIGLGIAVVSAIGLYALDAPADAHALLNLRFSTALIAVAGLFACGAAFTCIRGDGAEIKRGAATAMHVIAGFALLMLLTTENFTFVVSNLRASSIMTAMWAVGAVVFLVFGLRARSPVPKGAALIAFVVAVVSAIGLYAMAAPADAHALLNVRFSAALIAVAAFFAGGAAFTCIRSGDSQIDRSGATAMHVIGGFALLILLTAEDFVFAKELCALSIMTAVWALGAAAFMAAGIRWRSLPARASGRVALTMSILSGIAMYVFREAGYCCGSPATWPLFANEHFAAAVVPVLVAFVYPLALFFRNSVGPVAERANVSGLFSRAAILLLVLLTAEVFAYSSEYGAYSSVVLLWAIGSAALFAARLRWSAIPAATAGVIALGISSIHALILYSMDMPTGYALFLNLRFGVCVLGAALLFAVAALGQRWANRDDLVPAITTVGVVLLFLLLSAEPYTHCVRTIADSDRAAWSAQMSLSVVWSVYAAAMLAAGFWLRSRPMRFGALALFGSTGLKLVFVDLADVRQVYRIISFLVLGLLMIGASYLYHKVEKRLAAEDSSGTPPLDGQDAAG